MIEKELVLPIKDKNGKWIGIVYNDIESRSPVVLKTSKCNLEDIKNLFDKSYGEKKEVQDTGNSEVPPVQETGKD